MQMSQLWKPFEGATLLIPSGTGKHLFTVLTKPCCNECVALVNFTTVRQTVYHDPTCTITIGEHPFITDPTYVVYERAIIESVSSLRIGVGTGKFIPRDPVSSALFERICDGILASEATPQKIISYVTAQFAFG